MVPVCTDARRWSVEELRQPLPGGRRCCGTSRSADRRCVCVLLCVVCVCVLLCGAVCVRRSRVTRLWAWCAHRFDTTFTRNRAAGRGHPFRDGGGQDRSGDPGGGLPRGRPHRGAAQGDQQRWRKAFGWDFWLYEPSSSSSSPLHVCVCCVSRACCMCQ
jgi:hypothetical protein